MVKRAVGFRYGSQRLRELLVSAHMHNEMIPKAPLAEAEDARNAAHSPSGRSKELHATGEELCIAANLEAFCAAWEEAWRTIESYYAQTRAAAAELGAAYALVSATSPWSVRGAEGLEQLMSVYPAMRDRE